VWGFVTSHDNRAVLAFFTSAISHDVQGDVLTLILFDTETNSSPEIRIQRDVTQTFVSKIGPQGDLVEACVQHRELPGSVKVGDHLTLDLLDMHARNVRDEHIGLIAFSEHQQKS
jgi:hypothetical protein